MRKKLFGRQDDSSVNFAGESVREMDRPVRCQRLEERIDIVLNRLPRIALVPACAQQIETHTAIRIYITLYKSINLLKYNVILLFIIGLIVWL